MSKISPLPCLAVAVSLAGCGPAPVPETPPAPPPAPPAPVVPQVTSPARWLYRHVETLTPTASRKLATGGVVHGSAAGERWITPDGPPPAPVEDGGAPGPSLDTASMILPEQIAGILPVEQRWVFFGASGRAFVASSPLGPIEEVRQPPAPVRLVSVGRAAAIAVAKSGELLRSTDGGAHWAPLNASLSPAAAYSVAMRANGVGVVLGAPQRALATTDDGATWAPLALPPGGPHVLDVSEEGGLWLARDNYRPFRTHRLEGTPLAFVKVQAAQQFKDHPRKDQVAARYERDSDTQRALMGKHVLSVGRPYSSDPWKIELSELDHEGEWKVLHELEGCQGNSVAASSFGDELVLGCVRPKDKDAAPGAPAAASGDAATLRMVFYRSKDAGASWLEDGDVPLWGAWGRAFAGPGGFLLVQRACKAGVEACTPFAFRPAAGQPFAALETAPETTYGNFAIDVAHRKLVAMSAGGKPKAARFHTWSLDGHPDRTTEMFPSTSGLRGSLTVDEQGTVTVMAPVPSTEPPKSPGQTPPEEWKVLRSTDEGVTFTSAKLGPDELKVREVTLAGDRGLLVDQSGHYWETASAGKTWAPVTGIARVNNQASLCGRDGCVIGAERRLGWDLATEAAVGPLVATPLENKAADKVAGAAPLKCVAGGEAKPIAHALVDDLDALATAGSTGGRLTIPAASKGFGVEIVVVSASEKGLATKATALVDAAPNRAAVGSMTEVMMTPAGMVATRATYPVDAHGADVWISPVSAEIAWWRPQTGKVTHARLPPLGKGHMRGTFSLGERGHDRGELLWLTPDGVVFRPHYAYPDATDLFTFGDKGAPVKISTGALQSARAAVRTPAGLTLLDIPSGYGSATRFSIAKDRSKEKGKDKDKDRNKDVEPQTVWTLAPPGSSPGIQPLQRGNEAAMVVTWLGSPDGPAHGLLVPVRPADDPPEVTDLGLASLLVEHPRACGDTVDPGAVRLKVLLPRAARRPVLMEGGDKPVLMLAEAVVVVVSPQGQACVSDWIARGGAEMAIIPVGALPRAWSITATDSDWQDGMRSRDLKVRTLRCEEAAGLAIPASFSWKGF